MPRETSVKMDPSASYLMVGGMGGIGRSITQWVVQRGAKHLIILSRNAATQAKSQSFLSELQNAGCQVVVRNCDIADQKDLARVMEECERDLPPVRGVIQAAMVLQVCYHELFFPTGLTNLFGTGLGF